MLNISEISQFISLFYIDLKVIRIIEVHNFRTNKRISLIKNFFQDISNISLLFEFQSIVFSISKIIGFTSFFFYIDLNVIRIIEVRNFRTNTRISLIKELIQDISKFGLLSKFHSIRKGECLQFFHYR